MEEVPMLVDLRHMQEEFPESGMAQLWERPLLPSLLQMPPLLPKNLKLNR
jgi:hypothetical protein